jgi:hypothetical protein
MPAWIGPTLKVVLNPKNHVRRNISTSNADALTYFRKHTPADHLHRSYSDPGPKPKNTDFPLLKVERPCSDAAEGARSKGK